MQKNNTTNKIIKIVVTAMLCAVAFVLYLFEFNIAPGSLHLKLDFSDVPALFGGILFGPLTAVVIEFIKNVLELIFRGIGSQMGFGNLMDFILGCSYVVTFSLIYKKMAKNGKENKAIIVSALSSTVIRVAVGFVANYLITPLFFKYFLQTELSSAVLWSAIGSASILNLVKGVILSIVSFPLVKSICKLVKKVI